MSREDQQMKIRLPEALRADIEAGARESGRSLNAEIVRKLSLAYDPETSQSRAIRAKDALQIRDLEMGQQMLSLELYAMSLWVRILLDRLGEPESKEAKEESEWLRAKASLLIEGLEDPFSDVKEVKRRIDAAGATLIQALESAEKLSSGATGMNYEGDLDASRYVVQWAQRNRAFLAGSDRFVGEIHPPKLR